MTGNLKHIAEQTRHLSQPIMLVAGEASGDLHGAEVVRALLAANPSAEIFGMGGSSLRAAGMETVVDSEVSASVMGVVEVVKNLDKIISAFNFLVREASVRHPSVVILIDYPDFNLRLAKKLKAMGIKVLYYVCPQVWAWRQNRVNIIRERVDAIASIFPFETDFYQKHNVPVSFVGHPFLDHPQPTVERNHFLQNLGLSPSLPTVALLPGSRRAEVERLLPVMLSAFRRVSEVSPCQAIIPIAPSLDCGWVKSFAAGISGITFVEGQAPTVLAVSDAGVIASGTATMEAAMARLPFCAIYKVAPLTYAIARLLIRGVDYISMPNIIAGWEVVKEFIQAEVQEEAVACELADLLFHQKKRAAMQLYLTDVRNRLRGEETLTDGLHAADRVAQMVLKLAS